QLQTDQFEQQLLQRRGNLLADQYQYLQALDQFKLQLGLPTNIPIEQDDSDFRPLNEQFQRYEDLFNSFKAASDAPLAFGTEQTVGQVRQGLLKIFTASNIVKGTRFQARIAPDWGAWEGLSEDDLRKQLARRADERRRLLDKKADLESKEQPLS